MSFLQNIFIVAALMALAFCNTAMALAESPPPGEMTEARKEPGSSKTLTAKAGELMKAKLYAQAEILFRDALEAAKVSSEDSGTLATIYNNIADCCFYQGKLSEAESLFRRALALREGSDQLRPLAITLLNLADCLAAERKFEEAQVFYTRASATLLKLPAQEQEPLHSGCLRSAAKNAIALNRLTEAKSLFEQAVSSARQQTKQPQYSLINALHDYGLFSMDQKKYATAEYLLAESMALTRPDDPATAPHYARSAGELALVYISQHRLDEARPLLQDTISIFETQKINPEGIVPVAALLADVERMAGNLNQAEAHYKRSLAAGEKIYGRADPLLTPVISGYYNLLRSQQRNREAKELLMHYDRVAERQKQAR